MFSFSVWSLIEAISIWLTTWIDAFIIGSFLNSYYMGLYKTSITMVNTLLSLITSATTPVLFSALSRLQDDESQFFKTFLKFQRLVSALVFPLGIGVYLYSDLATEILLGSKWTEAAGVIAMWGITSPVVIVFSHYCSEVYRSKGMPKLSFYSQVLHLVFLVPTCIISAQYGFWALVYARSLIRFQGIIVHMIFIKYSIKLPILKIFKNVIPPAIATFTMALLCIVLKMVSTSILFDFISIAIAAIFYFCILFLFPKMRKELLGLVRK